MNEARWRFRVGLFERQTGDGPRKDRAFEIDHICVTGLLKRRNNSGGTITDRTIKDRGLIGVHDGANVLDARIRIDAARARQATHRVFFFRADIEELRLRTRFVREPCFQIADLDARHVREVATSEGKRAGHVALAMKNGPEQSRDERQGENSEPRDSHPF